MKYIKKWQTSLLKAVQLQLFISCISLPFLISWGLPVSAVCIVSTLIFSPFLTIFLLFSSIIFFCELFYIPNSWFIWCLEYITIIWHTALEQHQQNWLIAFKKPSLSLLSLIPVIALLIIHYKNSTSVMRTSILFAAFLVICMLLKCVPYAFQRYPTAEAVSCGRGQVTLITNNNMVTLIDSAAVFTTCPSYESWISYTLIPAIIQKNGAAIIDQVVITKLNKPLLQVLLFLASKIVIKTVYLPAWTGKIPRFTWIAYTQLKKQLSSYQGKMISVCKQCTIIEQENITVSLDVQERQICYYDAQYTPLSVCGRIGNEVIIF